jgi:DNA polymerase III subunit epsilon
MGALNIFNKSARGRREIVVDIETTGFLTQEGHRIVEVAGVELKDGRMTGREFHALVNPGRDIPADVTKVHGITKDKVKDKPDFAAVAQQLKDFIGEDPVIITCRTMAEGYVLDKAFLNMEFEKAGLQKIDDRQWVNVRPWSEEMFGDKNARLDKVLDRYGISRRERDGNGHSATLDARLLAEVYPLLLKDYRAFTEKKPLAQSKAPPKNNPPS